MKWWVTFTIIVCLANAGCATLRTGEVGVPLDSEGRLAPKGSGHLVLRSRELEDISMDHLPVLEVSFENRTHEWYNITAARILVGNPDVAGSVRIPLGQPLRDWQLAMQQRNAVAAANQETALELISAAALVAAAVGSRSEHEEVRVASATLGVGAVSALAVDHYSDRKQEAEALPLVPASHLLGGPISVPPGNIVKRWILLHTPKQADSDKLRLIVSYDLADQGTEHVLLRLKPPRHNRSGSTL